MKITLCSSDLSEKQVSVIADELGFERSENGVRFKAVFDEGCNGIEACLLYTSARAEELHLKGRPDKLALGAYR